MHVNMYSRSSSDGMLMPAGLVTDILGKPLRACTYKKTDICTAYHTLIWSACVSFDTHTINPGLGSDAVSALRCHHVVQLT